MAGLQVVIDDVGLFRQVVWLLNGKLQRYLIEPKFNSLQIGDIYYARVDKLLPGIDAAFVELCTGKTGFLSKVSKLSSSVFKGRQLRQGDMVVVQVEALPHGTKACRVTGDIRFASNLFVLLPMASNVSVSNRVTPKSKKRALREQMQTLLQNQQIECGVIVRSRAALADPSDWAQELTRLAGDWQTVVKNLNSVTAPQQLWAEYAPSVRALRETEFDQSSQLFIASPLHSELRERVAEIACQSQIMTVDSAEDVLADLKVQEVIQSLFEPQVTLPSGASIVIDRTEAMTTIDVNSGSASTSQNVSMSARNGKPVESMALRVNKEAVDMIAQHIHLRCLSGIILIDFVSMAQPAEVTTLQEYAQTMLSNSPVDADVGVISELGLLELSRRYSGESPLHVTHQQCHHCQGSGLVKSPAWISHEVLCNLAKMVRNHGITSYTIEASNAVCDALNDVLAQPQAILPALGVDQTNIEIKLRSDSANLAHDYRILPN